MQYSSLDKKHRTGCLRFFEYWKFLSFQFVEQPKITIVNKLNESHRYELSYVDDKELNKSYIKLVCNGKELYFPVLTKEIVEDLESNIVFDDKLFESDLSDLFQLINNKKNFYVD